MPCSLFPVAYLLNAILARDSRRFRYQRSSTIPANLVSAPVKRVPSLKGQSSKAATNHPSSPTDPYPTSPPNSNILNVPMSSIPRIVQTPATPTRAATVSGGTVSRSVIASTSRSSSGHKNRSLDIGYRYRGTMDIVDEEGRLSKESKEIIAPRVSSKGKGKEKEKQAEAPVPMPRNSISRMSANVRNTKHGSFDFERPGLGAIAIKRTGSNGTSTSGWSRSGEGVTLRESALGPGLAGVGTIQREISVKRGKEREVKEKEIQGLAKEVTKEPAVMKESGPSKTNPSPAHSSNGHQTPPSGTTSGKSSSLSKASGRRFFGKGLSGSRASTQHGLFSFEPPVPSPTWSTTSAATAKEVSSSWGGRTEKEKERLRHEKGRPVERKSSQRRDRSPVPVPLPKAGHRSGVKGRSLDLNLGLAWAPSKVREDALLPTSTLFHRSISNSSSVKSTSGSRSANSSAHGHDQVPEEMTLEEKSKIGRETAELFRKALGEARYMRFKTCEFRLPPVCLLDGLR